MLLGQVVPRVKLEDQDVVHPRRAPAVHVHSHQKYEFYQKQWSSVQSQNNFQFFGALVENTCKQQCKLHSDGNVAALDTILSELHWYRYG